MKYVVASYESHIDDLKYRHYVANSLQNIPQGKWITASFNDVLNPKPIDNRSGDEIVLDMIKKHGLHPKEK